MTDTQVANSGSFSDPSQAARLRDLLNGLIEDRVKALTPTRMTGMVLDIYQGGPTFNSDITVDSTIIPRTQDNPERPYVAKIRLDDKFEGGIVEARIDPNLIPIFRKADFFDEENPAGSGTMVDRAGRYITVEVTDDGSAPVDDTYPSLIGTTLQAPQAAPRVALVRSAASWRVSELIRGVLAIQTNPATLMLGPDYARFDTNTLTWGGTIAFARGSEIKAYEIYPDAPIVTYGSEPLEVSPTEPVEIVLGQRSGSMYLNFSATDGVPVLVWVEAGSDTPIPPEWYLVFARINDGDLSSKLVFSSLTDFRSPSAPDNLVLTYAKTGYEKLGLTASWDEVAEGTNGDPISISGYELWGMLDDEDWRRITTTTDTHVAGLTFDSSSEWHFKVRAMGQNGIPGVFSDVEAVTFPEETEVIGGGSKTYWQPNKPTEGNPGDEWFDTNDGNAHYIFDEVADDYVAAPFGSGALDEYVNNLINTAASDAAAASENAGLAIAAANGKNTIFIQATKPSLTGRVLGDTWFDSDDGNKIYSFDGADFVAGLLGTAAIADAAITNAKIANLDAAKVTTGSLDAARIAANSISVGKLVVADPENLWTNPFFNSAAATVAGITNKLAGDAGVPASCPYASCGARENVRDTPANDYYTFRQGDSFYMEAYVCTDGTAVQPLNLGVHIADAAGTVNNWIWGVTASAGTTTWTKISGIATPNATNASAAFATATRMRAYVQVNGTTGTDCQGWFVTNVQFRRANTSELIVDGSIVASKLAAGAITAGSAVIADGAIGNAKISNLAVDKLTGGTLQADINLAAKIEAGTSGLGLVQLDSTGIRVVDGSGIQQTAFNTTGSSVFKGDIEAVGIEASGSVKMHGSASEVSVNGKLYLATGVTAPSVTPSLSYILDTSIALVGAPGTSYTPEAVIRDDSNGEWLSKNVDTSTGVVYIYRHNADGTYKSTQATFTPSGNYVYYKPESTFGLPTQSILSGFAYIGGVVWVPRASWSTGTAAFTYDIQFQIYSSGGTAKNIGSLCDECNQWNYDGFLTLGQVIGSSTLIAIAHKPVADVSVSSSNSVTVSNLNPSTLAYTNSVVLPADFKVETTVTVPYLSFGNYDFGASRYLLCFTQSNFAKVARSFTTAGVEQTSENFQLEGISGVGYTGSVVWSANGSAVWSYIANISGDIKFAFSWYDSQGTTHETSISPISTRLDSVSSRRRKIRVTTTSFTPDLSGDGVDKIRIYGGLTEGTMFLQSEISTNQATYSTLASSGTSPNSGTAFPSSGTAAIIQNPAGTVKVDGAGSISATNIYGGTITASTSLKVGSADVLLPSTGISRTLQTMSSLLVNPNSSYCRESSGWWIQEATDAYVTTGNGYPVASIPGVMEVHVKADGTVAVQRYTTFEDDPRVFIRYYASSAWSAWGPVTNNALPKFKAINTSNTSLNPGYTRIINLTEEYDSHSAFNPSTGFFVAPVSGVYDLKAGLCFTTTSSRRYLLLEKGTAAAGSNIPLARVEGPATAYSAINISVDVQLNAGSSVAFVAYSASATTFFLPNFFSGRLVG